MSDLLQSLHSAFIGTPAGYAVVKRRGRVVLAFPRDRHAALRALQLYQPQRPKARWLATLLKGMIRIRLHWWILPKKHLAGSRESPSSEHGVTIAPGSLGVMFGNPDHKVPRAIVSGRVEEHWQVMKVAFGDRAWKVVGGEAQVLESLPSELPGKPTLLASHRSVALSWICLPYVTGEVLAEGETAGVMELLNSWVTAEPARQVTSFPEWPIIQNALVAHERGKQLLETLAARCLVPCVRHGDFARWNLLRVESDDLVVLDWEWGEPKGMPGIDLAHFFAQDARLVRQLSPEAVVESVIASLKQPDCQRYLTRVGWAGEDALWVLLVSLAYTFGAGQQANGEVLQAAVEVAVRRSKG